MDICMCVYLYISIYVYIHMLYVYIMYNLGRVTRRLVASFSRIGLYLLTCRVGALVLPIVSLVVLPVEVRCYMFV